MGRTSFRPWALVVASMSAAAGVAMVLAGPLDPPAGPVAPTYKTLTEIEPRTVVNAVNTPGNAASTYIISQPGSYYLDRELVGQVGRAGITISAANVTLDLNGFTMRGIAGATAGIILGAPAGAAQVEVKNGVLRDWPQSAVRGTSSNVARTHLSGLRMIHTGSSPAVQTLSAGWIHDCDIEASGSVGGGVTCDTTQIERTRVYGTVVASTSSSISHSTFVAPVGTVGVYLTGGGLNIAAKFVNNEITLAGAGTALRLSGRGHVVGSNRITGPGGLSTIGIAVDAGAQGLSVRDNIVKGTADNYQLLGGANNEYSLIICELPETIDVSAAVTLDGSLVMPAGIASHGLTVASDNVSIDLGGQALVGAAGSFDGINVAGARRGLVVRNGALRNWGSSGLYSFDAFGIHLENVISNNNGQIGFFVGNMTNFQGCQALNNGSEGFRAADGCQLTHCTAASNTGRGFNVNNDCRLSECVAVYNTGDNVRVDQRCLVQACVANYSASGFGILADGTQDTVTGCTANNNWLSGIRADDRTRVADCTVMANLLHGIHVANSGTVERCLIQGSGALLSHGILMDTGGLVAIRDNTISGFSAVGSMGIKIAGGGLSIIEHNHMGQCWRSLDVTSGANMITRNTSLLAGAGGHYSIVGGNSFGPIVVVNNVGDISGTPNSNHPLANFIY